MNTIARVIVSILVGVVAFALVTVGVTSGLQPRIEFSLIVGLPMGVFAGITAVGATYAELAYRGRRATDTITPAARRGRWAAGVAVLAYALVAVVGLALYLLADVSAALGLLTVGLPVALVVAAGIGYFAARGRPPAGSDGPPSA
jgi:hypothetical protein